VTDAPRDMTAAHPAAALQPPPMAVRVSSGVSPLYSTISLFAMLVFFAVQPFHHLIYLSFSFYREAFAALFTLLAIGYALSPARRAVFGSVELLCLLLYVGMAVAGYVVDPGIAIYPGEAAIAAEQLGRYAGGMYVLRNVLLYMPLLALLALRGLDVRELRLLLRVVATAAPLSVLSWYASVGLTNVLLALAFTMSSGMAYNSYVPYITFPLLAALYLAGTSRSMVGRLGAGFCALLLFLYIALTPSRQSLLFCLAALVSYWVVTGRVRGLALTASAGVLGMVMLAMSGGLDPAMDVLFSRGLFKTTRWLIMAEGLAMLRTPLDWLIGHGLSSVLVSGPHNNYIRVTQRMGLVASLLLFVPFFYAMAHVWLAARRTRAAAKTPAAAATHAGSSDVADVRIHWLVGMALFFTLYHSFFGYPHDDAYQAPYVWLALGIWLGMRRALRGEAVSA
jgi:hypothetical protein